VRAELGIAAVTGALWAAGLALLAAAGVVRPAVRSVLAWSGLAYLLGLACTGVVLHVAVPLGYPLTAVSFAVVVAVLVSAGAAVTRRRVAAPLGPAAPQGDRAVLAVVGAAVLVLAGFAAGEAMLRPVSYWDAWGIWDLKSLLIFDRGRLPTELASDGYAYSAPDYPLLFPLLDAAHYRVMGGPAAQLVTVPYLILHLAFGGALAAIGSRLTRPAIWGPFVLAALCAPVAGEQLLWRYMDVPTATLAAVGGLLAGLWLASDRLAGLRWRPRSSRRPPTRRTTGSAPRLPSSSRSGSPRSSPAAAPARSPDRRSAPGSWSRASCRGASGWPSTTSRTRTRPSRACWPIRASWPIAPIVCGRPSARSSGRSPRWIAGAC